jgi:hypothetical protein
VINEKGGIMYKSRNIDEGYFPGYEPWRNMYSPKKLSLLEKSWSGTFRKHILPLLPARQISHLYSSYRGRPTKDIYTIIGAVVLQQFFNLTDQRTVRELAFNEQWHFALECFNNEDQVISEKTLWTMRDQLVKLGLSVSIFSTTTEHLLKYFNVDVSKQRIDSVHVHSNMARLGRIRILVRTIIKFLKNLKRQNIELFNSEISSDMQEKYLKKSKGSYFGQIKPSESEHRLQTLADDLYFFISTFSTEEIVFQMTSFKLLKRVFSEHCYVENEQVQLKSSKDVSSDSVQNPSDPDAGYDGHKGQGFQTQIMETYITDEDREKHQSNDDKPLLNLITYVETESADKHDSHALEPALEDVKRRGQKVEKVLADTSYGSNKNVDKAKEYGVEIIAPTPGKPSEKGLSAFELNPDNLEVTSCLAGKNPDEVNHNKKSSITIFWYKSTCKNCPFADRCPTTKCKKGRRYYYKKNAAKSYLRRIFEESNEFKDEYRYRSGIEATNSRFIHMTGSRRLRYCGLEKMKFGQKLRALAINIFRIVKYLKKSGKPVNILTFFIYTFNFSFESDFKMKFAA